MPSASALQGRTAASNRFETQPAARRFPCQADTQTVKQPSCIPKLGLAICKGEEIVNVSMLKENSPCHSPGCH